VIREAKTIYFATDVQHLFPDEAALAAMDACSYMGTPLIDSGGGVIGHLFIMHDSPLTNPDVARSVLTVTAARAASELEHRLALRVIAGSEAHFHALLEEMTAGVIVTDMEDVITFVNHPMSELSGYADGEMLGRLASTLLIPEEDRRLLYQRNERRRQGVTERYDATLKRKDGTLFGAQIDAAPHRNVRGEVVGTLALVTPGDPAPGRRSPRVPMRDSSSRSRMPSSSAIPKTAYSSGTTLPLLCTAGAPKKSVGSSRRRFSIRSRYESSGARRTRRWWRGTGRVSCDRSEKTESSSSWTAAGP
jgi:PAS domain S-box-containing protein